MKERLILVLKRVQAKPSLYPRITIRVYGAFGTNFHIMLDGHDVGTVDNESSACSSANLLIC